MKYDKEIKIKHHLLVTYLGWMLNKRFSKENFFFYKTAIFVVPKLRKIF